MCVSSDTPLLQDAAVAGTDRLTGLGGACCWFVRVASFVTNTLGQVSWAGPAAAAAALESAPSHTALHDCQRPNLNGERTALPALPLFATAMCYSQLKMTQGPQQDIYRPDSNGKWSFCLQSCINSRLFCVNQQASISVPKGAAGPLAQACAVAQ